AAPATAPARVAGGLVYVALALVVYSASHEQWTRPVRLGGELALARQGREIGAALSRAYPASPRPGVGVIAAGGIALTWAGETVDLMGLNNLRMGHSKGDRHGWRNHAAFSREVFFQLEP